MLSPRENYLTAARGGKPQWVPSFVEDACVIPPYKFLDRDPVTQTDFYNIKWVKNEFGMMPDESWRALEDIHRWREVIKFPDLDRVDWVQTAKTETAHCNPAKAKLAMLAAESIFLIPVDMMGWVDGLCAIYEEPEELAALVKALADYYVKLAGCIIKYYDPDIVIFGDDVANAMGPFISRDIWTTLYKPHFKRICQAIKNAGKLAEFHCCGNCSNWLIDEFMDIGVDIVQLPVPNEGLLEYKKKYGNRLVITGGWERHGAAGMPGASEEAVRQSVRRAVDLYGRDGAFIFWDGGITGESEDSRNKKLWLYDELRVYGREVYK
jgi:uroporphyrinogen-III decarboxylase